jgi:hypothetical protein
MPRRSLTAPTKPPVTPAAVHPSAGSCALPCILNHGELPRQSGRDGTRPKEPGNGLRFNMRRLGDRWLIRFDEVPLEEAR